MSMKTDLNGLYWANKHIQTEREYLARLESLFNAAPWLTNIEHHIEDQRRRILDMIEKRDLLTAAIDALPFPENKILRYRYIDGMSHAQIEITMNYCHITMERYLAKGIRDLVKP